MIKVIGADKTAKVLIKALVPSVYHKVKRFLNSWLDRLDSQVVANYDEYIDGALDHELDPRDIRISEVLSEVEKDGRVSLPSRVLLSNGLIQNQGKTLHCVGYGGTESINETYKYHKSDKSFLPVVMINYIRKNLDKLIDERGTYIVNYVKAAKSLGWIKGYARLDKEAGLLMIKKVLAIGYAIGTGTNKIIWSRTNKGDKVAFRGAGGGHFIDIVGYDDTLTLSDYEGTTYTGFLIVENTWGKKWGEDGRYYIPYAFANQVLFQSRYTAVIPVQREDKKDKLKFDTVLDKILDKKTPGSTNRYFHLLEPHIKEGKEMIFNDYFEQGSLNAGEVKTLISLANIRESKISLADITEPKISLENIMRIK